MLMECFSCRLCLEEILTKGTDIHTTGTDPDVLGTCGLLSTIMPVAWKRVLESPNDLTRSSYLLYRYLCSLSEISLSPEHAGSRHFL